MIRRSLLSLLAVPFAIACGSSAGDGVGDSATGPRTMKGSVALTAYTLDNPVVIARSSQGVAYIAPVARDGRFTLVLPSAERYRVILASTRSDGTYRAVSEVLWGAEKAAWGTFSSGGATLDLGVVHPVGTNAGVRTASKGSGSGGEDDASSSSADDSSSSSSDDAAGSESEGCYKPGKADLPYNFEPGLGQTFTLLDAFLMKGAPPKAVLDVTMESGAPYHLDELKNGTPLMVTQADCDVEGNHGTGRSRINVTWENADGSKETDHMTIRYCNGSDGNNGTATAKTATVATGECKGDDSAACGDDKTSKSECDGGSLHPEDHPADPLPSCSPPGGSSAGADGTVPGGGGAGGGAAGGGAGGAASSDGAVPGGGAAGGATGGAAGGATGGGSPTGGVSDAGGACVTSANCGPNLACFSSVCTPTLR